jgi:hypothetical protein
MFRILNLFPPEVLGYREEAVAWSVTRSADRVALAALDTATLAAASTTTLYSINFTTQQLIEWSMGLDLPPLSAGLLTSPLNTPDVSLGSNEVVMYSTPKKAFPLWLTCSVVDNLYRGTYWQGSYGSQPNAANAYLGFAVTSPPLLFSVLVIDNWIRIRPLEWGIVCPNPKVNLKPEVRLLGIDNRQGWYASAGSVRYINQAASACPIKAIVYGVQALNVICQSLDVAQAPMLSRQQAQWSLGTTAQWEVPVPIPAIEFGWIPLLHVLEPCTLMSYSYVHESVRAPCLLRPNVHFGDLLALSNLQGQCAEAVGVVLGATPGPTPNFQLPASLDLSAIGALSISVSANPKPAPSVVPTTSTTQPVSPVPPPPTTS